jgi:hypothetical protein
MNFRGKRTDTAGEISVWHSARCFGEPFLRRLALPRKKFFLRHVTGMLPANEIARFPFCPQRTPAATRLIADRLFAGRFSADL